MITAGRSIINSLIAAMMIMPMITKMISDVKSRVRLPRTYGKKPRKLVVSN